MRGIILTMMAVLAMTSVALAGPVSLGFVADDLYVGDGYKSFLVQATGANINELTAFTITGSSAVGDVYQVFEFNDPFYDPTPWVPEDSVPGTGNPMDSYIMFGSYRLPEAANPPVTTETIDDGGASEGMGTLTNYNLSGDPPTPHIDGYLRLADEDYTPVEVLNAPTTDEVVNVFHLVLPDGAYATVDVTLQTADYDTGTGYYEDITEHNLSVQVNCPLDGDATMDGIVNIDDLDTVGTYYNTTGGMAWANGDFNGDGNVNIDDLDALGTTYGQAADWYPLGGGSSEGNPVPEPGTMIMLVLGALCFAGYRLRK